MRGRATRRWRAVAASTLCLLASGFAFGQAEHERQARFVNPFQPAPSDIRRPLTRALRAIEEGDYSDAAYRLGQLLMLESIEDAEAQDYFLVGVDAEREALVDQRLKARANELIASLPPEGRRAYELHFGDQARAELEEALGEGSTEKLTNVIRRFFHTRAGYEASLLAGRVYLARGKPMAAALHLQRLAEMSPEAADFEPELSILLATCWQYAEMPDRARQVLLELKARAPNASLRVGDRTVALFSDTANPLAWLDELLGDRRAIRDPEVTQWIVYQGNEQRNGRSRGSSPLMTARWLVPTTIEHDDEKIIDRFTKEYRDEGRAAISALHPLAVRDTILMRTPRKLLGVDFSSGKRIWVWPPWEDETIDPYVGQLALLQRGMAGMREQELHQRVWEDAAHGQITSDGESVFLLHELGYAPTATNRARQIVIARGGFGMQAPGSPRSTNQLVSLSLARQGAAQWIVGGDSGEDEPQLAGAFFLGPPLPMQGRLYAIAEFGGEIRLVVLEAQSGKLLWQQQLAHAEAETVLVDPTRRLLGATPSYEGGVLLCPTVAGALVAVDLSTRSLLWGYRYEKQPDDNRGQHIRFGQIYRGNQAHQVGSRWLDTTVTVADGRVLLTATGSENESLHCLDLLNGRAVWPPQPRGDRLYVACVHQGRVILVGTDAVEAIGLADGQPIWPAPVKLDDAPSGRGFYSDHYYFVPTAGAELIQIDLDAGKIHKRTSTNQVLGNLVCFRNEIISQGPDFLAAYYQAGPLKQRVEKTLAEHPQDVDALTRYGELLLHEGRRAEALETLRRANRLQPENDTIRALIVATLLDALREDFSANADASSEIESLIDRPEQRSEYLRLMADGWHQLGEHRRAFDAYLTLARFQGVLGTEAGVTGPELTRIDRQREVRTDRWLLARFGVLWRDASDDDRGYMDQTIGRYREQAVAEADVTSLRQFVRLFGNHPSARSVELQLATQLVERQDFLAAELLLQALEKATDPAIQAAATAQMARLLEGTRQLELAAAYYQKLADQFPDVPCRDGLTGRELFAAAMENSALEEAAALAQKGWSYGQVEIDDATDVTNRHPSYRRVYESQIRQRNGPAPAGLSVVYEPQPQNRLLIQNGDGTILHTVSLGNRRLATTDYNLTHARICGHLVLVSMGAELLAIDTLQDDVGSAEAILWRRDLTRSGIGTTNYQRQVQVQPLKHPWGDARKVFVNAEKQIIGETALANHAGVVFFTLRALVCADPLTGEVVWQRDGLPQGSDVFGDEELVFVVPPDSETALVFSAVDGQQLGSRPVPLLENRWATYGRNVLVWDQEDATAPLRLRLVDAWSGEEIWAHEMPLGTKGTLIDCDEVALLQPNGRLAIYRLDGPEARIEADLDAEPSLEELHVLRSQARYFVLVGRQVTVEPNSAAARIRSINFGAPIPLLTGRVYALDRQTGQRCWDQPAAIDRYGYHTAQPAELPILLFIRHYTPTVAQGAPRQHTSVLCLDRRDGRVLVEKDDINSLTYTFDVVADRREQTVTIGLSTKPFTITFTDQPLEALPQPAAEEAPQAEQPAQHADGGEAPPAPAATNDEVEG